MKQTRFIFAITGILLCHQVNANIFLTEQFGNYTTGRLGDTGAGNTGGTPGWYTPQNSITVTNGDGSLDGTFLGLVASAGDKAWIAGTNLNNGAYNKFVPSGTFPTGNATNIYTSFLYRFNVGSDVSTDGQMINGMNRQNSGFTSTATFSWFLHARRVGGNIQLGLSRASGTTTNWDTANTVTPGQTFFVVVRQQVIPPAGTPDVIDLWVNPPAAAFGTNEDNVPSPDVSTSDGTDDTSNTGPGRFWVISSGASANIDEIRIADNWAEATPYFGQCLTAKFTVNPTSQTNVAEINATFNVFATGTSPTYQWQISKDSGVTWNNIDAALFQTYTTPNLALASDNGNQYRAIATVPCDGSSVTSSVATITLTNPIVTPTGIIMDDTFDRDDRSVGPVTTNVSTWFTAGTLTDDLTTFQQNGSMLGIPVSGSSSLWLGYFIESNTPPVHLDIGRAIKVTLPFTPNSFASHTNNGALRFGLFDYFDGGARIGVDGANVTGSTGNGQNVRGYMLSVDFGPNFTDNSPLSLLARNGLGDNNLMGTTGDYISMGSGPSGGGYSNAPAFQAGTNYTLEFTVTRTGTNTASVAVNITGGGTNWSFTATDTNGFGYHRFDSFAIRPNSLETAADSFTFDEFKVEVLAASIAPQSINLTSVSRNGNSVTLSWTPSPTGTYSYTVQRKNDLTNASWTTLQSGLSAATYTDASATNVTGFYRISSP